jgi:CRISPR-associated protein Cas2
MFIIMAYDIGVERVAKALKVGRKYLTWIQNSVFEGEITRAKFERLKVEMKKIINEENDSVVFYLFRTKMYTSRETMGVEKGKQEIII